MKETCKSYKKEMQISIAKILISIIYFAMLNLAYKEMYIGNLEIITKIITMVLLLAALLVIEKSYKKGNTYLATHGIETLIIAAYTLTIQHIVNKYNLNLYTYTLNLTTIFAIYYILKSVFMYVKEKEELLRSYSDIREIVKKEA